MASPSSSSLASRASSIVSLRGEEYELSEESFGTIGEPVGYAFDGPAGPGQPGPDARLQLRLEGLLRFCGEFIDAHQPDLHCAAELCDRVHALEQQEDRRDSSGLRRIDNRRAKAFVRNMLASLEVNLTTLSRYMFIRGFMRRMTARDLLSVQKRMRWSAEYLGDICALIEDFNRDLVSGSGATRCFD